ncbi:MAG: hypothetical protein IAE78_14740 [Myxococcus sp.]|nr:hypothetical protein [Myxococcus sp.]
MRPWLLAVLAASCVRGSGPQAFDTLVGLEAPLLAGPGLRVAIQGQVFEVEAEIVIDVATPMTMVTTGCLDRPMVSAARVTIADPMGADERLPVTRLAGLTIAGRRLTPMEAGLIENRDCVVVLGTDRLGSTALQLDPSHRALRFVAARSREEWVAWAEGQGGEVQVLELTRDPTHDWPLLAARLSQGTSSFTGAFALSTRERSSRVFEAPVRQQGFSSTADLLQALALPSATLPAELSSFQGMAMDRVELSPGVGAQGLSFSLTRSGPVHGVAGALAADVWGRFEVTIDLSSNVLLLHRPRLFVAGQRLRCARGAQPPSEDACFELQQVSSGPGLLVTATVWRPLAEGGRLYLDFPGLSPECRIGFTFDAGDRGRSTQHVLPWSRLFQSMSRCAQSLAPAKTAALGLFEDSPLRECPGICAFAQDLRSGRVSCECQPGPLGLPADAERQVLERLRAGKKPLEPQAPEPADPDP